MMTPEPPSACPFETIEQWRAFVTAFNDTTLPADRWNHRAHLIVACWHLLEYPTDDALDLLRSGIRRYNEAIHIPNTDASGYHETVTRVFVLGIDDFLSKRNIKTPPLRLLNELLQSDLADSRWPLRFYSRERILSVEARKNWIDPDLSPAPGT